MNAKFICVAAEVSVAGAVAIPLPPGAWCRPRGVGPGLLGLRPSWGYSQTLPWPEVAPAHCPGSLPLSQALSLSFGMGARGTCSKSLSGWPVTQA